MDFILLLFTIMGTAGTYLVALETWQISQNQAFNESGYSPLFPVLISENVAPWQMRAMRLGRIAQMLRMLYKHKPMFDVMCTVFKSWKAILGVAVFSVFTVCMFTIICMHLMGGGRGPAVAECQDPMFCAEDDRSETFCLESYTNQRGTLKNIIVSPSAECMGNGAGNGAAGAIPTECDRWDPIWLDTDTGSLTDVMFVNGVGDAVTDSSGNSVNWGGSSIDWALTVDALGKPTCGQFDPDLSDANTALYNNYIAQHRFPDRTECVELDSEAKCTNHGRCKLLPQEGQDSSAMRTNYNRLNNAMCEDAEDDDGRKLYEWQPLVWVDAISLEDYPRQHFETFGIGLLTQLMVMLGDGWSAVMLDYMDNSAIGGYAAPFMSMAWLGMHGVLYSFFVAVLLINFSVNEEDKMPKQRSVWHYNHKANAAASESILLKQLKLQSGENEEHHKDDLVSKLGNSYDPEHAHRSFYLFDVRNPLRAFCASIEQRPVATNVFLVLVVASLVALTLEGNFKAQYVACMAAFATDSQSGMDEDATDTVVVNTPANDLDDPMGRLSAEGALELSGASICQNATEYFRTLEYTVLLCFWFDMTVRSITNGFMFRAGPTTPYLRRPQNRLNFIALVALSWTFTAGFEEDYGENRVRLVRGLAPMLALMQQENINDVVVSFLKSLPGVLTVVTPMAFVGLMFSVVGVEYFGSRLRYCVCPDGSPNFQNSIQLDSFELTQGYPGCIASNVTFCRIGGEDDSFTRYTGLRPGPGSVVHGEIQCDGSIAEAIGEMQGAAELGETGPQRGKLACLQRGYSWINPPGFGAYDSISGSMEVLFLLATSGYVEVLELSMDITDDPNNVSIAGNSQTYALFYIVFHMVFNFFLLNLFIGVMSSTFSVQTGKAIVTDGQKRYTQVVDMLRDFDPVFTQEEAWRPVQGEDSFFKQRMQVFDLVTSPKFHWTSIFMVFANTVLLCSEHYPYSYVYGVIAQVANTLFIMWFTAETILKLIAFGFGDYFSDSWLTFDALIVATSLALRFAGLPAGLEVFKVLRCLKILMLAKSLESLVDLMRIVATSLANSMDVVIISGVVFYIYATMGSRLFSVCGHGGEELNVNCNFETFMSTIQVLFQVMCGQQYTGIIHELDVCMLEKYGQLPASVSYMENDPEGCESPGCASWNTQLKEGYPGTECGEHDGVPGLTTDPSGLCGENALSHNGIFLYFASFYFMSVFISTNLFVVSVLDSFVNLCKVDQDIDRFDLWGFTFAWAELTIGAHACPSLTRAEAKEFATKLAQVLEEGDAELKRNAVAVKIENVPAHALNSDSITKLFKPYGTIADGGVQIKTLDVTSGTGGWAVINYTDKRTMRMVDCLSEIRTVDGSPVVLSQHKGGGAFANGVAHLKVPGEDPAADPLVGTLTVQIRQLKGFSALEEPYIKCTMGAKHKHHGGHDIVYQTRALSLSSGEEGTSSPRTPVYGIASPRHGEDSPSLRIGTTPWDAQNGAVFFGDIFKFHINEHTETFYFEAMDIKAMSHESMIGKAGINIKKLRDCLSPQVIELELQRKEDDGGTKTGAFLEVEFCYSHHTYVPDFHFLGDFSADNSAHKEKDSSGLEGWVHKKGPEHMSSWERTWIYIAMHPEPCLRMFISTNSEHELEKVGKEHQIMHVTQEFRPHEIVTIMNGLRTAKKPKKRKHHKSTPSHHAHKVRAAQQALADCEFSFEAADELDEEKNEDLSEENDKGLLHIHLMKGEGLPSMDAGSLTDAYVSCALSNDNDKHGKFHFKTKHATHKSHVVQDSLDPTFDEAWTFRLHTHTHEITFLVLDGDPIGADDPIGEVKLSIPDIIARGAGAWEEWHDLQAVKKGPGGALGKIKIKFEWCSPLDATETMVEWAKDDHEKGYVYAKKQMYRFRALSVEHKYAWLHALKWLQGGCTGNKPKRLDPPPLHKDDVRLAVNNVAMIDLPFIRIRSLLYSCHRFGCFECANSRDWVLYAMFQLETYAYKKTVKKGESHVVVHRSGIAAQTGLALSHIRGLNYHSVMERLALLQYTKPDSLMYSTQMEEYESEQCKIAIYVMQTCLSHWTVNHMARKDGSRLPEAAYWRRTTKDIELAKRESERVKDALKDEPLSKLRAKAIEYGVPQSMMDKIDDTSKEPDAEMLLLVLDYFGRADSRVNTGAVKGAFFIAAQGARNTRLNTLKRLRLLVKKNDPIVVYGDPNEDLKEELYKLAHPDEEDEDDPFASSGGIGCFSARKMKKAMHEVEDGFDHLVDEIDNAEKEFEKGAHKLGETLDTVTGPVGGLIGIDMGTDGEAGSDVEGTREAAKAERNTPTRQISVMEVEPVAPKPVSNKERKKAENAAKKKANTQIATGGTQTFENPLDDDGQDNESQSPSFGLLSTSKSPSRDAAFDTDWDEQSNPDRGRSG